MDIEQKIQNRLSSGGDIHGVVRPDLPEAHPWFQFGSARVAAKQISSSEMETQSDGSLRASTCGSIQEFEKTLQEATCLRVETVAAQLRSRKEICRRLVASAQRVDGCGCGGSLLLVSGGDPLRKLPLVEPLLLANSLEMLRTSTRLREAGDIPAGVQLWAVENPLANSVERLEQKIDAGAETLILQPPLLTDRFGEWWDAARTRGLLQAARVVVGLPFITSAKNLAFWFKLTETSGEQVEAKLKHLKMIEDEHEGDNTGLAAYYEQETRCLLDYVKSLPGKSF
ncbi:hypothetical protein R1sor_005615 [Riccia sorocarpa]|uniref:Methylenetetrahydrofolate reductase (NAD(P)H) n=1 Tax=Riccia sorocarpa TaxID=122646 RepID=A0ABD3HNS4_9MARC